MVKQKKGVVEVPKEALQAPVVEVNEESEVVAEVEENKVEESTDISEAKKAFMAKVEAYKISNPIKYERKKESFEATLKGME